MAAAEGRDLRRAGCFDVFVHPDRPTAGSNYAIPHDGARPTAEDVEALVDAFAVAARMPRLEYLPDTAPEAEAPLLAAGFEVELRTAVMTCAEADLITPPLPPSVTLEALTASSPLEDADALVRVQDEAFGEIHQTLTSRPSWLGNFVAVLARVDGVPAGGGMCLTIAHGTTELVGIATAAPFRRRGIAGAVTAALARGAFALGARATFMTPGDDGASRVYARAGFAPTDVMLHLHRPAARRSGPSR